MILCFLGDAAAAHLRRWSLYFLRIGHEVHVITWNPDILGGYESATVHLAKKAVFGSNVLSRTLNLFSLMFRVRRLIRKIKPDVIHAHSAGSYAWMASLSGFHPFIVTPWGTDVLPFASVSGVERHLTMWSLRKTDCITCDGKNMKQAMTKFGICPDKIKTIMFGVDVARFTPGTKKDCFRNSLALGDGPIVVSTRTLNPVHNVETFIRAIPQILRDVPTAKFVVVGNGIEEPMLMELAKTLGIWYAVRFLGKVEENGMITVLQNSDVYVSTSLVESGLAASTAEAMACGIPVVNTDTGDIDLWIRNDEGGFIIPARDPVVLAGRVVELLADEKKKRSFGQRNRSVIDDRNNVFKEMEKMEKIYKGIVKGRIG